MPLFVERTLFVPISSTIPAIDISPDQGARYESVRQLTELLADPLSPEDQLVQSMPDVSPTKWHRAHTTWFFETFLLGPSAAGYREFEPAFNYLFNSYYEAIGERHPRAERGLISRPSAADVTYYRQHVDDAMRSFLRDEVDGRPELAWLVELGLHHEQQHQELLLMDIKHVLSVNPLEPTYRHLGGHHPTGPIDPGADHRLGWVGFDGGVVPVGHRGSGFSFDNEGPCHNVVLPPYLLADRLVTVGEWLDFIADGGYQRPELWLSDGWYAVQGEGWQAPLYWHRDGDDWRAHTLHGTRRPDPDEPVVHVSHYEADAFARWAGARLPTEHEWEHAVGDVAVAPRDPAERGTLHPMTARSGTGLRQVYGEVWQWTSSPYVGYPGFHPAPGAVGEYNGKFMSNQMVLRGGCCVTPPGHMRATYRNFFPPAARWAFAGVRLAADA